MQLLLASFLSLFLTLSTYAWPAISIDINTDDLLSPDSPKMAYEPKGDKELEQSSKGKENIDEILGPKDIFPFLPDNHRDSGTGKFNSF